MKVNYCGNLKLTKKRQSAGFRDEYFNNLENTAEAENDKPFLHRYESILSSKTSEETMVNSKTVHDFSYFLCRKLISPQQYILIS